MSETPSYEIQVQGRIGARWAHWFEDMRVSTRGDERSDEQNATTTLTGTVADQAALLGLLQKLYTLGLPLLLVQRQQQEADLTEREEGSEPQ
jgi:hypothetical protein